MRRAVAEFARVAHTAGGGFSAVVVTVCGEQGKCRTESATVIRTSKPFVSHVVVLESRDHDFSWAFVHFDGLSTLPRQTIKTAIFSLSLRLNKRGISRGHPKAETRAEQRRQTPDEPPTTRPSLCTAVGPRVKGPVRPRIVSTHVSPPGLSPKPGEGVSPGRTDRVQCHSYARRRRSTHRQPGDHGLASGVAARAHRSAVRC